jgi:hypothetical protein
LAELAKLLRRRDAETAEISAEKAQLALASLRLALRLCVEIVFLFGSGFAGLGRVFFEMAQVAAL